MTTFLCFGDSITYGQGEFPCVGWAGRFKREEELKHSKTHVYNLGIPGDTTRDLRMRIEEECKERINQKESTTTWIIIAIGANDARGTYSPKNNEVPQEEFVENLQQIIKSAKKYTPNIALLSLIPVDENLVCPYEEIYFSNTTIQQYNTIIKHVAKEEKCIYIDLFTDFYKQPYQQLLADGLHPNSKGYDEMYRCIKENFLLKSIRTTATK